MAKFERTEKKRTHVKTCGMKADNEIRKQRESYRKATREKEPYSNHS